MDLKELRKHCIDNHRKMWHWLAENPDKNKQDWPGWEEHNGKDFDPIMNQYCFLCGYVSVAYGKESYHACPLDWGISEFCEDGDDQCTYYEKYCDAIMHAHRAKYAEIIANLPEKDDVEEISI